MKSPCLNNVGRLPRRFTLSQNSETLLCVGEKYLRVGEPWGGWTSIVDIIILRFRPPKQPLCFQAHPVAHISTPLLLEIEILDFSHLSNQVGLPLDEPSL